MKALAAVQASRIELGRSIVASESFRAAMAAQLAPTMKALAAAQRVSLGRIDSATWGTLATGAELSASVYGAQVLREEAAGLVDDPTGWLAEAEEAAQAGDERARVALLLVQYLYGCFLLLAQRLNPSAKTIERVGGLVALSVLMTVVVGTTYANSPKTLEMWNTCLGAPLGILGIFMAVTDSGGKRARRNKPSLNRRGNSKPRTKMLRRAPHR